MSGSAEDPHNHEQPPQRRPRRHRAKPKAAELPGLDGSPDGSEPPAGSAHQNSPSSPPSPQPAPPAQSPLRRTVIRPPHPGASAPDPVDAAFVAGRLTSLTHELANLLDGSLRLICLARRNAEHAPESFCQEQLSRQLTTVHAAMQQMAGLVRDSMIGLNAGSLMGLRQAFGSSSSIAEAVGHAVDVMMPLAEELGVRVTADVAPELDHISAGPIYAVVANGVRNAIESIQRGERRGDGRVDVRAWMETGRTGRCVRIEVADNGQGPPAVIPRDEEGIFRLGYTTKPGGSGVGLSLSRDVIEQLGGTIELLPGTAPGSKTIREGAVLSVKYPAPSSMREERAAG